MKLSDRKMTEQEKQQVMDAIIKQNPKFKNNYNAHEFPQRLEKTTQPSITVPDMALSVMEILDRHARGLTQDDGRVPLYSGGSDFLDGIHPDSLDLSEKFEILKAAENEYWQKRKELETEYQKEQKKKFDDLVRIKAEEFMKAKNNPQSPEAPQA